MIILDTIQFSDHYLSNSASVPELTDVAVNENAFMILLDAFENVISTGSSAMDVLQQGLLWVLIYHKCETGYILPIRAKNGKKSATAIPGLLEATQVLKALWQTDETLLLEMLSIDIIQRNLESGTSVVIQWQGQDYFEFFLDRENLAPVEQRLIQEYGRRMGSALRTFTRDTAYSSQNDSRSSSLQHITHALTSTMRMDEVISLAMCGIQDLMHVEAGSILLLDQDRETLVFKRTLVGEPDWIHRVTLKIGEGLAGECFRLGEPLLVNDVQQDERFYADVDSISGFRTRNLLCVPLIAQGQKLGVLEVINKSRQDFDVHDLQVLQFLASIVASSMLSIQQAQALVVANADLEARCWEIRRSQTVQQNIFDSLSLPQYVIDHDFHLVAVNVQAAKSVNSEPHLLLGLHCYAALHERKEQCPDCRIMESLNHGVETIRIERRWEQNGDPQEWEVRTFPVVNKRGQITQALSLALDVTERHRLETARARDAKLAAVERLAAGVAHEINNPLVAIIANSQLLQRELGPDDIHQESVDLIAQAGDRALRVVQDLLDLAQQEQYRFVPTDVNETLRSAVNLVKHQFISESIVLEVNFQSGLPLIMASQDHLQGVWLNLLLNARDALRGQQGRVLIRSVAEKDNIAVSIEDNGIGISTAELPNLFEPFYTTKEPGAGTGLGLSVCHRIIRHHGGRIQVESSSESGTSFTVLLPVRG